ncbi:MFS transporter [Leifsonia shinshuensis]|uniref:MFS transporter n=1 Tax=Leifsonia shinshuensis TaxID=150026 RepID=A0A7G6YBD9_9MICO|nr:MFS transporter [Leifsonia shinshuensis]QNE35804.1 MFS transporter [Leifsonia shinshuensis]
MSAREWNRGLSRRRAAIFVFMLVYGVGLSSWVVRTPAVRDLVHATTAEMGLVLLGLSIGSMTGVLISAGIVRRHGVRLTVAIGGGSVVAGLAAVALAAGLSSGVLVFGGLALIGWGMGLSEIALNVEGAALEGDSGRSILPALHGCFSLGTVIGAVVGVGLTAVDFPVGWHLLAVAFTGAVALGAVIRSVPAATGRTPRAAAAMSRGSRSRRPILLTQPRLLMLGVIVLSLALAEGSATDWLPLLMVDGHGASATVGTVVFAGFAAAMTVGRFGGGLLLARFGKSAVLRVSTLVSAAGIAAMVFADAPVIAGSGVALWGLGAALGFPVTLSAAADGEDPTSAVAAVATAGYVAFLVGPPVLGIIGQAVGLRGAMVVVLIVVAGASLLTSAAKPRAPRAVPTVE